MNLDIERLFDRIRREIEKEMEDEKKLEVKPVVPWETGQLGRDWENPDWKPRFHHDKREVEPPPPLPPRPVVKIEYPPPRSRFAPDWVRMNPEKRRVPPWMEDRVTFRPYMRFRMKHLG
jgi:hypothetical protein